MANFSGFPSPQTHKKKPRTPQYISFKKSSNLRRSLLVRTACIIFKDQAALQSNRYYRKQTCRLTEIFSLIFSNLM